MVYGAMVAGGGAVSAFHVFRPYISGWGGGVVVVGGGGA